MQDTLPNKFDEQHYRTTNSNYGFGLNLLKHESGKLSAHNKNCKAAKKEDLPKNLGALSLSHNPEEPCGIMNISNVATNTRGEFTNVRNDVYGDRLGPWTNSAFNTRDALIEKNVGTYSNLQGGWSRVGTSTYDMMHSQGTWTHRWPIQCKEPPSLRVLYDHKNINPYDNFVPKDPRPQNQLNC